MPRFLTSAMLAAALAASGPLWGACASKDASAEAAQASSSAMPETAFSGDSALALAAKQVSFGPRVPGTEAHRRCREWIAGELKARGADSVATLSSPGIHNILARFNAANPGAPTILLLAHYDTRPTADADPDPANHMRPFDGANDGASGVAVLLETARCLGLKRPPVNVDILMVDAEDGGSQGDDDSWCLGSQHFAANLPYAPGEMPSKAVLLDMVGGRGAVFHREWLSERAAPALNNELWGLASRLGMGSRFIDAVGNPVTDDHLPLLRAGIPTADIIENNNPATGTFPPQWHTMADDMQQLSPEVMADVGRLVTTFIYLQKQPSK